MQSHLFCAPKTSKLAQYHILQSIGDGGYGTVYKAIHRKSKNTVAIKHIKIRPDANQEFYHKFLIMMIRELDILQ